MEISKIFLVQNTIFFEIMPLTEYNEVRYLYKRYLNFFTFRVVKAKSMDVFLKIGSIDQSNLCLRSPMIELPAVRDQCLKCTVMVLMERVGCKLI